MNCGDDSGPPSLLGGLGIRVGPEAQANWGERLPGVLCWSRLEHCLPEPSGL